MVEDYTNPEDDKSVGNNPASTTPKDEGFKPLSRFSSEQNIHLISLGIQLSSNHPVIKDDKFLNEIQEKIKGLALSSNQKDATIQVDGSVQQISQFIKQLGVKVINIEAE